MQPSFLFSISLRSLLVRVALKLWSLRFHSPRLCRIAVFSIQTIVSSLSTFSYIITSFTYRRAAFFNSLKSKTGLMVARASALRININIDGRSLPTNKRWRETMVMSTPAVITLHSLVQTPIFPSPLLPFKCPSIIIQELLSTILVSHRGLLFPERDAFSFLFLELFFLLVRVALKLW